MNDDNFHRVPSNVSTIADLLDTRQISWGEYQEHLPYPGFQGYNYSNQETYADDYVRKHNPLILYDSITQDSQRLSQIKNFTSFNDDLANRKLPQWAFITPNMTNDAHDTNITFASKWERNWLKSLLNDSYFMNNSLIMLSFDEDNTYSKSNRIFTLLLGGAVPDNLKGTVDDTFYTHYSTISTVSANWGLPSLGRWDCGANIFELVSNKTGYVNYNVDTTYLRVNETYPGPLAGKNTTGAWPIPLTDGDCVAGNGILDSVKQTYAGKSASLNYSTPYPFDESSGYNTNVKATKKSDGTSLPLFCPGL